MNFSSFQAILLEKFSIFGMLCNEGSYPKMLEYNAKYIFRSPAKINTFLICNMKFTMEISLPLLQDAVFLA